MHCQVVNAVRQMRIVKSEDYERNQSKDTYNPVVMPLPTLTSSVPQYKDANSRYYNWVFTLNNWTDEEIVHLKTGLENGIFSCLCFGYELSKPKPDMPPTPHLQGYMEFRCQKFRHYVKKIPGCERMHLEPRYGTKLDAISYCAKEWGKCVWMFYLDKECTKAINAIENDHEEYKNNAELKASDIEDARQKYADLLINFEEKHLLHWMRSKTELKKWLWIDENDGLTLKKRDKMFFIGGNVKYGMTPGKRTDIDNCRQAVLDGKNIKEIGFNIAQSKQAFDFAKSLLTLKTPERRKPPLVYWITGDPGQGKSRAAHEMIEQYYTDDQLWDTGSDFKYFEGYCGQPAVLFDDFRGSWGPYDFLIKLIDRYPMRVAVKYGSAEWKAELIIFTSIYTPQETLEAKKDCKDPSLSQFFRRLTATIDIRSTANAGYIKTTLDDEKKERANGFAKMCKEKGFIHTHYDDREGSADPPPPVADIFDAQQQFFGAPQPTTPTEFKKEPPIPWVPTPNGSPNVASDIISKFDKLGPLS